MRACQLVSHPACSSKHLFLLKLPGKLSDQVAKKMERLDARELAEYADTHWHVKNSKKCPGKVVAAVEAADVSDSDNGDLLPGAVAAVPPGKGGHKKKKPQGPPQRATYGQQAASHPVHLLQPLQVGKGGLGVRQPQTRQV